MRPIKVVLAKPGLDGHNRGVQVVARALRDSGMEVVYLGIRKTPFQIAKAAEEEDADVVGLSCLSGAHLEIFPQVAEEIRKRMTHKDVVLICGGIIPEKDREVLKEKGFAAVFTPGSSLKEIVDFIKGSVKEREDV
ncbi:MAG: cobalamin B12-binding domain-containing protein [Planctomycetota bacterium]|nr:cobalamin B12-binding domain-containing protein [Planctomycetota bacterium]